MNVLKPILISVLVFCGIELQFVVHNRWQGDVGKVLHLQEPLKRKPWLDGGIRIAFGVANLIDVVFYALHESSLFKVFCNLLATVETVHAHIQGRLLADGSVGIENVDGF